MPVRVGAARCGSEPSMAREQAGDEKELSEEAEDVLVAGPAKSKTIRLEGATYTIGKFYTLVLLLVHLFFVLVLRLVPRSAAFFRTQRTSTFRGGHRRRCRRLVHRVSLSAAVTSGPPSDHKFASEPLNLIRASQPAGDALTRGAARRGGYTTMQQVGALYVCRPDACRMKRRPNRTWLRTGARSLRRKSKATSQPPFIDSRPTWNACFEVRLRLRLRLRLRENKLVVSYVGIGLVGYSVFERVPRYRFPHRDFGYKMAEEIRVRSK